MRLRPMIHFLAGCLSLCLLVCLPLTAQQRPTQERSQVTGGGASAPASFPQDMSSYMCSHYDADVCDMAPAPPPD
jgi:hypothetical protein